MGAGRSGSTALATILGSHDQIFNAGELHQFFEHVGQGKACSCGNMLNDCQVYQQVVNQLPVEVRENAGQIDQKNHAMEFHTNWRNIFGLLPQKNRIEYLRYQHLLFEQLFSSVSEPVIVDSSKYVGRALLLSHLKGYDIYYIFLVRDCRGVINSFRKSVQTPKKPWNTAIYYNLINLLAELGLKKLKPYAIRIRYEDLIQQPLTTLDQIKDLTGIEMDQCKAKISNDDFFDVGHIIGGNRLKTKRKIKFVQDISWKSRMKSIEKIVYFVACLPCMLRNKYKL